MIELIAIAALPAIVIAAAASVMFCAIMLIADRRHRKRREEMKSREMKEFIKDYARRENTKRNQIFFRG